MKNIFCDVVDDDGNIMDFEAYVDDLKEELGKDKVNKVESAQLADFKNNFLRRKNNGI